MNIKFRTNYGESTLHSLTDLQDSIDALTAEHGMAEVIFSDNAYLFSQTIRVSNNACPIVFTSDSSTTFYGKMLVPTSNESEELYYSFSQLRSNGNYLQALCKEFVIDSSNDVLLSWEGNESYECVLQFSAQNSFNINECNCAFMIFYTRWLGMRFSVQSHSVSSGRHTLELKCSKSINFSSYFHYLELSTSGNERTMKLNPAYLRMELCNYTSNDAQDKATGFVLCGSHMQDETHATNIISQYIGNSVISNYYSGVETFFIIDKSSDISFSNICFKDNLLNDLYGSCFAQGEASVANVIDITSSSNIAIRNCEFTHLYGYCVGVNSNPDKEDGTFRYAKEEQNRVYPLPGQSSDIIFESNNIHDTYGGGLHFSGGASRCLIKNNFIQNYGEYQIGAVGLLMRNVNQSTIIYNTISGGYHTGISLGWRWGYEESDCYDNVVAYNHIYDCLKSRLSDGAGLYNVGKSTGTLIENNIIHDIRALSGEGYGIYLDEGSSGILVRKNVCHNCDVGFYQHYGLGNELYYNIFAANDLALRIGSVERHLSCSIHNNYFHLRALDAASRSKEQGRPLTCDYKFMRNSTGAHIYVFNNLCTDTPFVETGQGYTELVPNEEMHDFFLGNIDLCIIPNTYSGESTGTIDTYNKYAYGDIVFAKTPRIKGAFTMDEDAVSHSPYKDKKVDFRLPDVVVYFYRHGNGRVVFARRARCGAKPSVNIGTFNKTFHNSYTMQLPEGQLTKLQNNTSHAYPLSMSGNSQEDAFSRSFSDMENMARGVRELQRIRQLVEHEVDTITVELFTDDV